MQRNHYAYEQDRKKGMLVLGRQASKDLQSCSSASVCGGVVDLCQSELWETLTDLWHHSTCCSKAHIKTEERAEGIVKKKRGSWLETELRAPPSLILYGVTQVLRNAAELLTPEKPMKPWNPQPWNPQPQTHTHTYRNTSAKWAAKDRRVIRSTAHGVRFLSLYWKDGH